LSAASTVGAAIVTAWRGAALTTLALGSTTTLSTAALRATLTATALSAATTSTGPRLATRVSLPLSAFCRAHECGRRDDHHCRDEEWFGAHAF
jgi:hypothetical protein